MERTQVRCYVSNNWPEAQRVDRADGARAHRENVAHDAADAGGRALKRLHCARMIVRLDLERDGDAVADVNDAGVFLARADEDLRRLGGKSLKQRARVFVTAMLAPHDGENAQLGVAWRATAEDFFGVGVFFRRQIVFGDELGCDGGFGHGKIQSICLRIILSANTDQDSSAFTSNTNGFKTVPGMSSIMMSGFAANPSNISVKLYKLAILRA